jgi:hypothetical protein
MCYLGLRIAIIAVATINQFVSPQIGQYYFQLQSLGALLAKAQKQAWGKYN